MNSTEKKPVTDTVADEATKTTDSAEPATPAVKPIDPKAEARRRSKEDLERKRRNPRKGGRF